MRKKDKWTNKENDQQKDADSLLHKTSHTQCLYKNSKSFYSRKRKMDKQELSEDNTACQKGVIQY